MKTTRILCALLALCLLASLSPAFAGETEAYDLYLAGVQVTDENKDDLSVIDGVDGGVRYDPATKTLTLENAEIRAPGGEELERFSAVYGAINRLVLTVELYGTNRILGHDGDKDSWGIYAEGLTFRLHDGASLTVQSGACPGSDGSSAAILSHYGPITFDGTGSVTARSGDANSSSGALRNNGKIVLNGSVSVTAEAGAANSVSAGVSCNELELNGGLLKATAAGSEKCWRTYGVDVGEGAGTSEPTLRVNGGRLIAIAGPASAYGFGSQGINASCNVVDGYDVSRGSGLHIAGGMVFACTTATVDTARALYYPVALDVGTSAGGSPNADGSGAIFYDAAHNDDYRWFCAPYPAPRCTVEVKPGAHMALAEGSGGAVQTVVWYQEIEAVIFEAEKGYYFPEDYAASLNGIRVERLSDTQIRVIGLPEAITELVLPEAAKKPKKSPFDDVEDDDWFADAVLWAVDEGITNGTSETTFSPDDNCTRAQVVTFLWRAVGSPEPTTDRNPFRDVKKGAYYYKAVLWAVENDVTTGTGASTFSPNRNCTRAQVVTFLWRAEKKPAPATNNNPFRDVKKGAYYYDAVLWAVEKGITQGTDKTHFSPNAVCTRAQIVTFLYRDLA